MHEAAPAKPGWAEPCNGCGVCCAYAPCPVGVLISKRRSGACAALEWVDAEKRYRCGVLVDPTRYTGVHAVWALALIRRLASRMISAGSGCDCSLEVEIRPE
ncbi:MAG: hypothetical protein ACKOF9_15300 [Burkholderiales bacterium]